MEKASAELPGVARDEAGTKVGAEEVQADVRTINNNPRQTEVNDEEVVDQSHV